jgi:hypothetical protein
VPQKVMGGKHIGRIMRAALPVFRLVQAPYQFAGWVDWHLRRSAWSFSLLRRVERSNGAATAFGWFHRISCALTWPLVFALGWLLSARSGLPLPMDIAGAVLAVALTYAAIRALIRRWMHCDWMAAGSAHTLRGTCFVFQVFAGGPWSQTRRRKCLAAVRNACRWLDAQARSNGVELTLITEPGLLLMLPDVPATREQLSGSPEAEPYDYDRDRVRQLVEGELPRLETEISRRLLAAGRPADNVCLLVHTLQRGQGFALPEREGLREHLEACVCGVGNGPEMYAHELLHLFGAPDLYLHPGRFRGANDPEWDEAPAIVAAGHRMLAGEFGSSVMFRGRLRLRDATLDPITLRAIGWRRPGREYLRSVTAWEQAVLDALLQACDRSDIERTGRRSPENRPNVRSKDRHQRGIQ